MQYLKKNKLQTCKDKLKYYKNIIYPRPHKLFIDKKYYPFEKTHIEITDYKKFKNFLYKNKQEFCITNFNRQKYSFTGELIIKNKINYQEDSVIFKIHFYKIDSEKYIIEFQRRSGCALTWYRHYRFMKEQFNYNKLL